MIAERQRMGESTTERAGPWKHWGPYLSERAWGTVREDYSEHGTAWDYFPHDHARSRVYRWSEDGLAGISDLYQRLCFALALWNGRDPILKERVFGLTGPQGNHGEDAKEYWWYLDSTPTHSFMRWRYHYPQAAFPYEQLIEENARRGRNDPEYELLDTGVFDGDRYFVVTVDYAKAAPHDLCIVVRIENAGPDASTLHVLPTLWFRNTWSWGIDPRMPRLRGSTGDAKITAEHRSLGTWTLAYAPAPGGACLPDASAGALPARPPGAAPGTLHGAPTLLFCDNETNFQRLFGVPNTTAYPKDGIGDHLIHGAPSVNPALEGTKAAVWYPLQVASGASVELRLRLFDQSLPGNGDLGAGFDSVMADRRREADEYYAELTPPGTSVAEALVLRQAAAGLLWSKQLYHYDVNRWLEGDPAGPPPPETRKSGRNSRWRHLNNDDVISMPDKWEYPWYAAWDLAFHCVALARLDPVMAKYQLGLLCREWYMHPNGQLPAYEWSFDDVNPPVHAWAALRVFEIAGDEDYGFLERIFHKLSMNFTWWVNREDAEGNNVFEGGFLGLDNIGPFDRSAHLPIAGRLEQSDGTAWMAMYCLNLLEMAIVLARHDPTYQEMATKFFEHFSYIATALNDQGLWDEQDGFYYDVLHLTDGTDVPLRARSMVGLVSLFAVTVLEDDCFNELPEFGRRARWFIANKTDLCHGVAHLDAVASSSSSSGSSSRLVSVATPDRLARILSKVLDEGEFLSAYGLRSLSAYHREHPLDVSLDGTSARLDYEPGESTSGLFGGNSNWRGPIWFPLNYLAIAALHRYDRALGDEFKIELPTGSGNLVNLSEVATSLSSRLVSLFLEDAQGRRPVFGSAERLQSDPRWHDLLTFNEYFHGDLGTGLGASHQTGWTALVLDLILELHGAARGSR